jgi:hypothetical protein
LPVGQNQFASLHHHPAVGGAIGPTPGIELLQKSFCGQRQIAARSVRTRAWRTLRNRRWQGTAKAIHIPPLPDRRPHCKAPPAPLPAAKSVSPAGPVAQWLEPAAHNGLVPGSSPGRPTKDFKGFEASALFAFPQPMKQPILPLEEFVERQLHSQHLANDRGDDGRRYPAVSSRSYPESPLLPTWEPHAASAKWLRYLAGCAACPKQLCHFRAG